MPKVNLTDSVVRAAKLNESGSRADYFDTQTTGLVLRVSPKGTKTWIARFRHDDKQQMVTIGRYPEVSLRQARDAVAAVRVDLGKGINPAETKREAKAERREALTSRTISTVGQAYLHAAERGRHKLNAKRPISADGLKTHSYAAAYVDKMIGETLITDLKRADLEDIVIHFEEEYNQGRAVIVRNYLSGLYSYAVHRGLMEHNPILKVYKPTYQSRDRVVSDDELRTLIHNVRHANVWSSAPMRIAVELCAVTAARAGEVAGIMLSELDLDQALWTIPGHRTKNRKVHIVPLSGYAMELISKALTLNKHIDEEADHAARGGLALFRSPSNPEVPITGHALTRAFRRVTERTDIDNVRLHDLRRTAATGMAELGISSELISKVLNHTNPNGSQITGVYNRHGYVDEKRRALDAWAHKYFETVDGQEPARAGNVFSIKQN